MQGRVIKDALVAIGLPYTITHTLFLALTNAVAGLVVATVISWQLTLVFLACVPIVAGISLFAGRFAGSRQTATLNAYSKFTAQALDISRISIR